MAMNGLSKMAATALLVVLTIVPAVVIAETHTVGGSMEWSSGVNYEDWVKGKSFKVGDTLVFTYGVSHSVDEMDEAGYNTCSGTPIKSYIGGSTTIDLETAGTKYFICPRSGHCGNGMKVAVTVAAASPRTPAPPTPSSPAAGTPAAPPPSSPTPKTPTTPDSPPAAGTPATLTPTPASGSTPLSPPPPTKPSGASKGLVSYVLAGVSMVLVYGLCM